MKNRSASADRLFVRLTFAATALCVHELRVELDLGAGERLRHRAALFGALGVFLELGLGDVGDGGLCGELDPRDLEALADLLEMNLRRRADPGRGKAALAQPGREGHRETAGVGGADQFFRIRAGLTWRAFETGSERVGQVQGAAARLHRALAVLQRTFPNRVRGADCHASLLGKWGRGMVAAGPNARKGTGPWSK